MSIENLKEGLEIFIAKGVSGHCLSTEHDILYVADAYDVKLKLSEFRQLRKLGFHIDSELKAWATFV